MAYQLVTAPAIEPISLADAKRHLRVDFDDDDVLIAMLLAAARQNAESYMGRALVSQVWDFYLDDFPRDGSPIKLMPAPVIEVQGVFYGDDSPEPEMAASGYILDTAAAPARLTLVPGGSWPSLTPSTNAVRIRFRAGYADGRVPDDIKAGILLNLGSLYANRETVVIGTIVTQLPWAAEQLLRRHRIHTAMA